MKSLKTKMSIGFYVSVLYNSWLDNIHSQRTRSYWLQIQESFAPRIHQCVRRKTRTEAEKHLGVLGPMLHAEIGDTIEVTFENMASRKIIVHTHGLYYT